MEEGRRREKLPDSTERIGSQHHCYGNVWRAIRSENALFSDETKVLPSRLQFWRENRRATEIFRSPTLNPVKSCRRHGRGRHQRDGHHQRPRPHNRRYFRTERLSSCRSRNSSAIVPAFIDCAVRVPDLGRERTVRSTQ